MQLLPLLVAVILPSLLLAATTHTVKAGEDGLSYIPNTTHAAVGDTVTFLFSPFNHNIVQGPYDTPCQSGDNKGINSGFFLSKLPSGTSIGTFEVKINDTNPIWFYCSQRFGGGHCTNGMVGVINPPGKSDQTLDNYKLAAAKVSNQSYSEPDQVQGGVVVLGGANVATISASGSKSTSLVSVTKTVSHQLTSTAVIFRNGSTSWTTWLPAVTPSSGSNKTSGVPTASTTVATGASNKMSGVPTASAPITAGVSKMEGKGCALGALVVGLAVALL